MSNTGIKVNGNDLSTIFKANYSGKYTKTVYYTAKNGEDLSKIFEPCTTDPNSKISYNTGYSCPDYGDLKNAFMDKNYIPIQVNVTGNTSSTTYSYGGKNYTLVAYAPTFGAVTGSITITGTISYAINYLLLGGGGGGGGGYSGDTDIGSQNYGGSGGGGAAGQIIVNSFNASNGTTYSIVAGGKAEGSTNGNSSYINNVNTAAGGPAGGNAPSNGTGGGGAGNSYSTGNGGGGTYGEQIGSGNTYSGGMGGNCNITPISQNGINVSSNGIVSGGGISYKLCGGGGGGSSNGNLISGGSSAGGAGGNQFSSGGSGNGFDGGYGGGGGGGGGAEGVAPWNAGNGGRGGPGLVLLWWVTPS